MSSNISYLYKEESDDTSNKNKLKLVNLKNKWAEYTPDEQNNIGTMETVAENAKIMFPESYEQNTIYQKSIKRVDVLKNQAERERKANERAETAQKARDFLMVSQQLADEDADAIDEYNQKCVNDIIENYDYYYIAAQNTYVLFLDGEWTYLTATAMSKRHPILNIHSASNLYDIEMVEVDRVKLKSTYTFKSVNDNTLNLMRKDNWLQPVEGDVHPYFNVLLQSLSSGKQENHDHLEHVIAWKYMHPEDFQLPCVVIYGDGAVGKGILLEHVFGGIFTQQQCVATKQNDILGNFNSTIIGKTVVMVDEISANKNDMSAFKTLVGNATVNVNEKGLKQYKADQTALFFAGSNDVLSAISLAGDGSDRRWSIMRVVAGWTLRYWLDKYGYKDVEPQDLCDVVANEDNLAKWLHQICNKWKDAGRPKPLHGEDYTTLIDDQKSELEELCERVFLDEDFIAIKEGDLWDLYKLKMGEESNWKGRNKKQTMIQVRNWVDKNAKECEFAKIKKIAIDGDKTTARNVFLLNDFERGHKVPDINSQFVLNIREELVEGTVKTVTTKSNSKLVDDVLRMKEKVGGFND